MSIVPFEKWTAKGRWWPTLRRSQRSSAVVIHHSVTTVGLSMLMAVRQVEAIIFARRFVSRFSMIAYNYLITPDGQVWEGRGLEWRNAANNDTKNTGYGNATTISVCFVGNYQPDVPGVATVNPTDAQIGAAGDLIRWLAESDELHRGYVVVGHREVDSTACPGDLLAARIDDIAAAAQPTPPPPPPPPATPSDTGGPLMLIQYGYFVWLNEGWRYRQLSAAGSVESFKAGGGFVWNLTGEPATLRALLNEAKTAGRLVQGIDADKLLDQLNES